MMLKLFAMVDLFALSVLFIPLPRNVILFAGLFILLKGLFFFFGGSLISLVDAVIGFYIFFIAFGLHFVMVDVIFALFLAQKIFFSFISK